MSPSERARELWRNGDLEGAAEVAGGAAESLQRQADPESRAEMLRCWSVLGHVQLARADVAAALMAFGKLTAEVDDAHVRPELRAAYRQCCLAMADIYRERFPELADRYLHAGGAPSDQMARAAGQHAPARTVDEFALDATAWLILSGRTTHAAWNPYGYFVGIGVEGYQDFQYRSLFKRVRNSPVEEQREAVLAAWDAGTPSRSRLELRAGGTLPASSDGVRPAVDCVVLAPRHDTYGEVVFAREGCVALVRHENALFAWQVVRHEAPSQSPGSDEWRVHAYSWPGRERRATCGVAPPEGPHWPRPLSMAVVEAQADRVVLRLDWTAGPDSGTSEVEWDPRSTTLTTVAAPSAAPGAPGPDQLAVRPFGTGEPARDGRVVVPGQQFVAVFPSSSSRPVFVPPNAAAIAIADDRIFSWRVERRTGASGVGRGDYDWVLEVYAWPSRDLVTRHVLACRDVIERCWPDRLDVPAAHGGRLVTFTARNEDGTAKVHVVLRPDGPSEVRDRAQAVALAEGED